MFNSLLALRQACCHPCIGSGGIETSGGGTRLGGGLARGGVGAGSGGSGAGGGGQGRWLSMDQILDRCACGFVMFASFAVRGIRRTSRKRD